MPNRRSGITAYGAAYGWLCVGWPVATLGMPVAGILYLPPPLLPLSGDPDLTVQPLPAPTALANRPVAESFNQSTRDLTKASNRWINATW